MQYKEAELYRNNPATTHDRNNFVAVSCYSSTDLVNWTFENNVLERQEVENQGRTGWLGRMGVVYIHEKKQYALFIQHNNRVLIALSSSPV